MFGEIRRLERQQREHMIEQSRAKLGPLGLIRPYGRRDIVNEFGARAALLAQLGDQRGVVFAAVEALRVAPRGGRAAGHQQRARQWPPRRLQLAGHALGQQRAHAVAEDREVAVHGVGLLGADARDHGIEVFDEGLAHPRAAPRQLDRHDANPRREKAAPAQVHGGAGAGAWQAQKRERRPHVHQPAARSVARAPCCRCCCSSCFCIHSRRERGRMSVQWLST